MARRFAWGSFSLLLIFISFGVWASPVPLIELKVCSDAIYQNPKSRERWYSSDLDPASFPNNGPYQVYVQSHPKIPDLRQIQSAQLKLNPFQIGIPTAGPVLTADGKYIFSGSSPSISVTADIPMYLILTVHLSDTESLDFCRDIFSLFSPSNTSPVVSVGNSAESPSATGALSLGNAGEATLYGDEDSPLGCGTIAPIGEHESSSILILIVATILSFVHFKLTQRREALRPISQR